MSTNNENENIVSVKTMVDFKRTVEENKFCLVFISASWCRPCKRIKPYIFKKFQLLDNVLMIMVDADEGMEIYNKLKCKQIPMLYSYVDGEPQDVCTEGKQEKVDILFQKLGSRMMDVSNVEF